MNPLTPDELAKVERELNARTFQFDLIDALERMIAEIKQARQKDKVTDAT